MAYSESLANRIRETLVDIADVREKNMMGGLTFMVNEKMCVGIFKGELMCRIDPALVNQVVEKTGCRVMTMAGRSMKGYVLVDETGIRTPNELAYWISLCLDFNKYAKQSKKRK